MDKLTDNEFTRSFFKQMQGQKDSPMHSDISKQEIQKCWKLHIPYLYKDKQRIRKNNRFIRANSDGSEDIVELIDQKQAIYSRDIHFRKIKTSKQKGEGVLFLQIKK